MYLLTLDEGLMLKYKYFKRITLIIVFIVNELQRAQILIRQMNKKVWGLGGLICVGMVEGDMEGHREWNERPGEKQYLLGLFSFPERNWTGFLHIVWETVHVCVCERESEWERETERGRERWCVKGRVGRLDRNGQLCYGISLSETVLSQSYL